MAITPIESPVAQPFWEATRRRELVIQWCSVCERAVYYPRELCPRCHTDHLEWRQASGRGTIHAVAIDHRGVGDFDLDSPYVVALVDLEEGARVLTNIVGGIPDQVRVGMKVRAVFSALPDGRALTRFEPDEGT